MYVKNGFLTLHPILFNASKKTRQICCATNILGILVIQAAYRRVHFNKK